MKLIYHLYLIAFIISLVIGWGSWMIFASHDIESSPTKIEIINVGAFNGCYEISKGKYPTCEFKTTYSSNYLFSSRVPLADVYGLTNVDSVIVTTKYSKFGSITEFKIGDRGPFRYDQNLKLLPL